MSLSDPRKVIEDLFIRTLDPQALDIRGGCLDRFDAEGFAFLEIHLAGLPRKVGRELIDGGVETVGEGRVDLGAWRVCDMVAADLLLRLPPDEGLLEKIYFQGDAEERRMVLRTLPFISDGAAAVRLMEEAHRTNDEVLFESGTLDSDLASRMLDDAAFNRVVMKCAFMGLPKERLLGWEIRGNDALSLMLFDFMTEREAAGRPPWADTFAVCGIAPAGLRARAEKEDDPVLIAALQRLLGAI